MNLDQQLKEPLPAVTPAGRWRLDRARSEIRFGVRKMGLYTVRGRFTSAAGEIVMGDEGLPISAEITVDAASVTTRMPPPTGTCARVLPRGDNASDHPL